jgi:hypothetical protein
MTKAKLLVYHAAPVNSMTLWVQFVANYVWTPLFLAAKEETPVAQLVQRAGRPKTAVPNALRAVRERLVTVAKIVQWGLHEREMTLMQHNADNVNWVKQQQLKVQPRAVGVI